MDYNNITVSVHARERYIERISRMEGKDMCLNVERDAAYINNQIIDMVDKATELYYGSTEKNCMAILLRYNVWLILIDANTRKVITLYYVDLGLGDEYSMDYLNRMEDKLKASVKDTEKKHKATERLTVVKRELDTTIKNMDTYEKKIKYLQAQIEDYQGKVFDCANEIKNLRKEKEQYENDIEEINVDAKQIVNTLLQRQVY